MKFNKKIKLLSQSKQNAGKKKKKKCLVLLALHWEFVRGTETHREKQLWKLYRKFATEKMSLWQPTKEPLDSSHTRDLTIVEQEVTFLVDDHYRATGIASHLTTISPFLYQSGFKTQRCKGGLN